MKAIYFNQHGSLDVLKFGDLPDPKIAKGEALIKVKAVAINRLDCWVREGWPGLNLSLPHITGSDMAGEIVEMNGSHPTLHLGDRVVINPGYNKRQDQWTMRGEHSISPGYIILGEQVNGGMAEYASVPISCLYKAPLPTPYEELAAPLLVGLTCWRMLFKQAQLKPKERVLIVGSGGGVNLCSLRMAKALGCRTFVLSGSEEKINKLQLLAPDVIINYNSQPQWHKLILQHTEGVGVDLVVDNVGAATLPLSMKAVRRGGRIVTVGNTSGHNLHIDNRLIFSKQISLIGSTMGNTEDFESMLHFFEKHHLKMPIDSVYKLSEGIEAVKKMESGSHFGKLVLVN